MKRSSILVLAFLLALTGFLVPSPRAEEGPVWDFPTFDYTVKVWSTDGHIYYYRDLVQPNLRDEVRYYAPDGATGTFRLTDVRVIEFPKNIGWWHGGKKETEKGRMADVWFWDGTQKQYYVWFEAFHGRDPWGDRRVDGRKITKIEFVERVEPPPVPPQVFQCPNGHEWPEAGFRFCPYDGQKLTLGPRKK